MRAQYALQNVGNAPLVSFDVSLPDEETYGRRGLRVLLDGRDVSPQIVSRETKTSDEPQNSFHIPCEPAWPQKEKRSLEVDYDLAPSGGERIAVDETSFHLEPLDWFPVLEPPKKLFAHDVERPDPTPMSFFVPGDFLLIANGQPAGIRKSGAEKEFKFRLPKKDLEPFVVAGRYYEQRIESSGVAVIFWTFDSLPSDSAHSSGAILAGAWKAFEDAFGLLGKNSWPARIVETRSSLAKDPVDAGMAPIAAFPGGILVRHEIFALGISSRPFIELAERGLAHCWIGERMRVSPEAQLVMERGFASYATVVAEESRGGAEARRLRVSDFLTAYDEARRHAAEKPLSSISTADPPELQRLAEAEAPLFFVALEDQYGAAPVRQGLGNLVATMRGDVAGFPELRSSLESSTGKNLADFFRAWLDRPGIPADFRARYAREADASH